jgi:phosphate transport system substrate-binding protein
MKVTVIYFIVAVFSLASCEQRDKHGKLVDTPTSGDITIVVDETLRPLIETEIETFNGIYKHANVKAVYLSETDAINALMKDDSMRLAIVTRHLTNEEKTYFKETIKVRPIEVDVAVSGIALIVNPANVDSLISIDQLRKLITGEITRWEQIGGNSKAGIEIVFDNPGSGVVRHLKDSIAKVGKLPANCFAVKNNEAVVDYVSKNKNALGLIGVEWISDSDDSTTNTFLSRVKVVGVSGDSIHFQPYQAYMALKHYPLTRTITTINREGRTGLGTGFVAFFASERGQRIVLKAGLVPKTMPLRIVQVNPKPFQIEK